MKHIIGLLCAILALSACAPASDPQIEDVAEVCDDIWTINSVTVLPDRLDAATQYYEAAWLPARVIAKRENVIKDYRILSSAKPDQPDFQLVTVYEDDTQFAASEEAFQAIFRELNLSRPLLIDGLERSEIIADTIGADDYRILRSDQGPC